MQATRRFVMAAGAAALASGRVRAATATRRLKLLVLGGTSFLGPAIVEHAMSRGHQITLFNRGKTNPQLFPEVEKLRGDRTVESADLAALDGNRNWDAAIDVWPSNPHVLVATASRLRDRINRYLYVSSIVAYKDLVKAGAVETDALFDDLTNPLAWYEFDKAQSERALYTLCGDRATTLRAPILTGYRQGSDVMRFWLVRLARGGRVLAPGDGNDPVQYTSIRDVAAFAVHAIENDLSGPFNVVGPQSRTTMRETLTSFNAALGNRADLVWLDDDFLARNNVSYFSDLPMYLPPRRARKKGFMLVDNGKAVRAGMSFVAPAVVADDEMRWFKETMKPDYDFGVAGSNAGISKAREAELLRAWEIAGHT